MVAPRPDSKPEPVSRRLTRTLIHTNRNTLIGTVFFAPDGKWIAGCGLLGKGGVQIWDTATGKQLRTIPFPEDYLSQYDPLPRSPDGQTLYVPIRRTKSIRITKDSQPAIRWEVDGEIQVWNLATGRKLPPLLRSTPPRGILGAALSSDGHWLAAVECRVENEGKRTKDVLTLWDIRARTARDLTASRWSFLPSFAPDGKTLAAPFVDSENKRNGLALWDVASGKRRAVLHAANASYGVPVFSPDGRYVADSLYRTNGRPPPEVKLWEVATGKEVGSFAAPEKALNFAQLAFSPDGRRLAASAWEEEGKVVLYDVPARKRVWVRDLGKKSSCAIPFSARMANGWRCRDNNSRKGSNILSAKTFSNCLSRGYFSST